MIKKSVFTESGESLGIGVLFDKIDKENRTVSGFATLDNVDKHGDIISAEASWDAFSRFGGGLREMHQPIAVGTLVNFEETIKYDPETDKSYRGIYVHARVSEGAQDTWKKVLDGTLKGFSIGGKKRRVGKRYDPDGTARPVIEQYDLNEISLVDNPANPLARVLTVKKVEDAFVYPEDDTLEKLYNILYHEESGDVILSEDENRDGFVNIGWTDSFNDTTKIREALDKHLSAGDEDVSKSDDSLNEDTSDNIPTTEDLNEGGATVAKEEDVKTDETVEKAADVTEVTEEQTAAEVSEVENNTGDELLEKLAETLSDAVAKAVDAARESQDKATDVQTSFEKSLSEVLEKVSNIADGLNEAKSSFEKSAEELEKRLSELEDGSAVKKSADIVDEKENDESAGEEDDFWRGSGFLGVDDLTKG